MFLKGREDGWHALPEEVAEWWRLRATLDPESVGDGTGRGRFRPTAAVAGVDGGNVVLALDGSHGPAAASLTGRS